MNLTLLSRILAQPWAARREHLALLTQLVIADERPRPMVTVGRPRAGAANASRAEREVISYDGPVKQLAQSGYQPLNDESWIAASAEMLPPVPANITVLLVWGILGRAWSSLERWWLDAVEVDELTAAVANAPEDSTVVLWFRSPGGIITGIPETAAALRKLGNKRRLLAFTDDLCASAAYWLAAQCERMDATPTAEVGSIGVYIAFYDWCAFLEKQGIKLELFKAGEQKGLGLIGNPLTDKDRASLQAGVDEGYRQFTKDVLRNRDLAPETMQGQCVKGDAALAANLVDGFFASAADYFAALGKGKVG